MGKKSDLLGRRFGSLTVIERCETDNHGNIIWKCKCDCGNVRFNSSNVLLQGASLSCGCSRLNKIRSEVLGKRFGRLVAIREKGRDSRGAIIWECKCDCGNITQVTTYRLTKGIIKSCGCYQRDITKELFTSHNMSRTRLYKIWQDMKARCNNSNTPYYHKYGGRGISVCAEWNTFEPFRDWALANGYQENLTIDRIDVNGNYEPNNCRWITNQEQQNNKRTSHFLTYNGKTQTITEWGKELGIKPKTLQSRIMDYHWSVEKSINNAGQVSKKEKCI